MLKRSETVAERESIFWERLEEMHLEERAIELNERRAQLTEMLPWATGSKGPEIQAALVRINSEIKRVNRVISTATIMSIVHDLFGKEAYEAVRIEMERRRGFPYAG